MAEAYDVIIVGGGHNGLTAAAYLAMGGEKEGRNKLKVLVLERYRKAGGAAMSEEIHPGFTYSTCSYVCSLLFLVPLIRRLSGLSGIQTPRETARLGRDLAANDLREDYLRARLETRADGTLIATPVTHQDSSLLGYLSATQALVIRAPFAPAAAAGTACEILRLPE